jgi:hypothetical protein
MYSMETKRLQNTKSVPEKMYMTTFKHSFEKKISRAQSVSGRGVGLSFSVAEPDLLDDFVTHTDLANLGSPGVYSTPSQTQGLP